MPILHSDLYRFYRCIALFKIAQKLKIIQVILNLLQRAMAAMLEDGMVGVGLPIFQAGAWEGVGVLS